jgi:Zn-dependent protease
MEILGAFLFTILLHEYGHLTAALAQGVPVKQLGWKSFHGAYIKRETSPTQWREMVIWCAGPAANLMAAAWFYPTPWWWSFNLVLGLSNLIPLMSGSDGDRMLRCYLKVKRTRLRLHMIAEGTL